MGERRPPVPDARLVARLTLSQPGRRVQAGSARPARAVAPDAVSILVSAPSTFDPAAQSDVDTAAITAQLYETMTAYDAAQQLQPALARSWDVAEDGTP